MVASGETEKIVLERILSLKQVIRDGKGGPIELHELGVCYFHLQNFRQASEFLAQLMDEYPDYLEIASVQALRIFCLIMEGDLVQARDILEDRLKLYPYDTRLLGMLAHIREKEGRYRKAIDIHRKILDLEPENANSLNNLGYLLALHGKKEDEKEAFRCLQQAIRHRPNHPAYLDSFGVFLNRVGQNQNARRALEKALRFHPENPEILEHLREAMIDQKG